MLWCDIYKKEDYSTILIKFKKSSFSAHQVTYNIRCSNNKKLFSNNKKYYWDTSWLIIISDEFCDRAHIDYPYHVTVTSHILPPALRPYIYTKTLLTLNVRKSVPPAPFFEPNPPNQQEETTTTNIDNNILCIILIKICISKSRKK